MEEKLFGNINGQEIYLFTLKSDIMEIQVMNYGAALVSVKVPDKNGELLDVVLGCDNLKGYINDDKYLGASVGRCANRIYGGRVVIGEKVFRLSQNDGENHIHGGFSGFSKKIWNVSEINNGIKFSYLSPDGEEGYPGNLLAEISYILKENSLCINFRGKSDRDSVFNPTNHTYFNLEGSSDILNHFVKINADYYTENSENSLPNGKILHVKETPMDFRDFKQIGADIESDFSQINSGKGFDNNWVVKDYDKTLKAAAAAFSQQSGILLEVLTDLPGVQFYSGNYLNGVPKGKTGFSNGFRSGFCLECQYFPNSFAHENFEKPILRAGEIFDKNIVYKFSMK